MRTLVIGASGHLGSHLVRILLAGGHGVRALIRPTSSRTALLHPELEIVLGDILDPPTLASALRGIDWVFHLAAPTTVEPNLVHTVVHGTANVVNEAVRAGVARLIYTSSTTAVGYSRHPDILLDETSNVQTQVTEYHRAKWEAEKLVLALGQSRGLDLVVVNPSMIVGPLDFRVTPSTAPIQSCLDRGLPFAFTGGLTVAHVNDVATGHLLAASHGLSGERYILGGERVTVSDYFQLIAKICGRWAPPITLARPAMLAAGALLSAFELVSGRPVPFTASSARHIAGRYAWYSSEKARAALGYTSRPIAIAVNDYVSWVRAGRPVPSED
jgi:dihydroflavonol-4-reductase